MSFLELYKNKQLGSEYILVIPKGTMEYKEDASGTGRKFPKKKKLPKYKNILYKDLEHLEISQ